MTGGTWAFSAEELRVLAAVSGAVLPPSLAGGDAVLAETVATRGLVARGLLVLGDDPPVWLAPGAADRLGPLFGADAGAVIELGGGALQRHVVIGRRHGPKLTLHEREPQVWVIDRSEKSFRDLLWRLLEEQVPVGPEPTEIWLEVPTPTADDVDRLAAAGEWERVDNRLRQAGVPAVPAAVWRAALAGGRGAGQLRVTRRLGDDAYVGGEVRWWDAGNLGVWRIVVPIDAGGTDQTLGPGTVIADVGGTAIVSDLSELIGGIEG